MITEQCPHCKKKSDSKRDYCESCLKNKKKRGLGIVCSRCGAENQPIEVHCFKCGHFLAKVYNAPC